MENLLECKRRRFSATIFDQKCIGRIQIEDHRVYLCQNNIEGMPCEDKLGFTASWAVNDGSELSQFNVYSFKLLDEEPKTNTEEKAKEIYESMLKGTSTYTQAKEASLIAVGYIERVLSDLGEYDVEYWNEVKLEIEKL